MTRRDWDKARADSNAAAARRERRAQQRIAPRNLPATPKQRTTIARLSARVGTEPRAAGSRAQASDEIRRLLKLL